MAHRVVLEDGAAREIRKLPKEVLSRVIAKAEALAHEPRPPGCKKLKGIDDLYRVRAGGYRIVYCVDDRALRVLVVSVGDRSSVYERLRRKRAR
jgi:mRNA interferase RelE/StbE